VGQVYIFSGQPYFCKPPGLQTGGTNCCQSTKDWFGLGSCDSQEQKLAQLRSDYECNQVGTYCSESFLGVCLQTMQSWCCFGGELAELIQVQVKGGNTGSVGVNWGPSGPGGTQSWVAGQGFGSADSPNCGGFTPTQFQKVDFSQVNLTPFYQNISTSAAANTTGAVNSAETKFQNEVSGANP
jgi:conjugal transfer mating pair stabilization protein TraN